MALPTGQISLSQVNVELGLTSTATISLNQANVRSLAGVSSGAISMQNLQGKSSEFAFSIVSNQTNANLATLATNAGWNGSSKLVATINSDVVIGSTSTSAALTISGSYPGGVDLINNGTIVGKGGNGGVGPADLFGSGQGGGGGGGAGANVGLGSARGGVNGTATSGGAGGARIDASPIPIPTNQENAGSPGGAGGLGLSVTSAVTITNNGTIAGGGGGGGSGTTAIGQVAAQFSQPRSLAGGAGGARGAAGAAGEVGFSSTAPAAGGAAGAAINGNSNITYLATGTRLGAIT